jgi:hypothetical protein
MKPLNYCAPEEISYPKWTTFDALTWKTSGGAPSLNKYKDSWVIFNRQRIINTANRHNISPQLLASVAWIEVGGKPDGWKDYAYFLRAIDWSGSDWANRHLTVFSKSPLETSFGGVSIQLRAVAKELDMDPATLSFGDSLRIISCLKKDAFNLDIVAKHLHGLILYDYPDANTANLSEEQFIVAGSRYNRGTQRALKEIINSNRQPPGNPARIYSSYGRTMLRHKQHIAALLKNY